ncbi:type II toxin-antitoxin system VapC family toxin [Flexivirga meconopsidis]|uniref:type II toxin-antitoxin system VapC family toxin n=1 Tax=Flexivirga meconopsidis TaxID=2977121 RepID=UPI00223EECBF
MSDGIAFDADVLIYAASHDHPLGARVRELFADSAGAVVGVGSVLLLPEVLTKPMRQDPESAETDQLIRLLSRLELRPVDEDTGRVALSLAVGYGLRAADAAHLATGVVSDAKYFLTNNRKDFPKTISEIEIVYPSDLQPLDH